MAKFPRPNNAIADASEMEVGQPYWELYGIWPPCVSGPQILTRSAGPFRDHPKYDEIHAGHADHIVFDTRYPDSEFSNHNYAADGNMAGAHSHNDNYWFRSAEDAYAARDFLTAQWKANPDAIADEIARRRLERDEYFYDDHAAAE